MITRSFPQHLPLVCREDYIVSLCRGKRVLHLGCAASPIYETELAAGRLLHPRIMSVAEDVLGIDIDGQALRWLRTHFGGEYVLADLEDSSWGEPLNGKEFDLILLPDVLEHVNNPFCVLSNITKMANLQAKLLVSVPNSYSAKGMARAILRHERIHPDHVAFHSFYTLQNLLRRAGWEAAEFFCYLGGGTGALARIGNVVLKQLPWLAEGVGVLAVPAENEG